MPALTDFMKESHECRGFDSSFEKLPWRDSSTTLHQRNLQKLMTEIFKVKTGMAPELMEGVFEFTDVTL